jgi:hypothetical protein
MQNLNVFNPSLIWKNNSSLDFIFCNQKSKMFYDFVQTRKGYVYAMRPPGRDDLLKIGRTSKNPFIREKTLSSAGVIGTYRLLWVAEFVNSTWAEANIHRELKPYHEIKEFFKVNLVEVKKLFEKYELKEKDILQYLNRETLLIETFDNWFSEIEVEQLVNY